MDRLPSSAMRTAAAETANLRAVDAPIIVKYEESIVDEHGQQLQSSEPSQVVELPPKEEAMNLADLSVEAQEVSAENPDSMTHAQKRPRDSVEERENRNANASRTSAGRPASNHEMPPSVSDSHDTNVRPEKRLRGAVDLAENQETLAEHVTASAHSTTAAEAHAWKMGPGQECPHDFFGSPDATVRPEKRPRDAVELAENQELLSQEVRASPYSRTVLDARRFFHHQECGPNSSESPHATVHPEKRARCAMEPAEKDIASRMHRDWAICQRQERQGDKCGC